MIIDEEEYLRAIMNYFNLYRALEKESDELKLDKSVIDMFNKLIEDCKLYKIDLQFTHEELLKAFVYYSCSMNEVPQKKYKKDFSDLLEWYYAEDRMHKDTAFKELSLVILNDEMASQLDELNDEMASIAHEFSNSMLSRLELNDYLPSLALELNDEKDSKKF